MGAGGVQRHDRGTERACHDDAGHEPHVAVPSLTTVNLVRSHEESRSKPSVTMCPGGLIVHLNGDIAACTEDDEPDGCTGRLAILQPVADVVCDQLTLSVRDRVDSGVREGPAPTSPIPRESPKPDDENGAAPVGSHGVTVRCWHPLVELHQNDADPW